MKTNLSTEYFATIEDPIELAAQMQNKVRVYRDWVNSHGIMSLWEKKIRNYYGNSISGNSSQGAIRGGSEGELTMIKVNDLRALVQEQLVVVTSQRPAGQAKAVNSDSTSLKNARMGTALSEYYMSQVGFETKFVTSAEIALLCDEGFIDLFWDKTAGDPVAIDHDTGRPEMSGDIIMRTHCPWNVARDPGMPVEHQKWYILSIQMNKFDAAAAYPQFNEQILTCQNDSLPDVRLNVIPDESDVIWGHLLVHDRTPAVPNGRYALMIGDTIVMDDQEGLPYPDFPIGRIAPANVIDGATGYCSANDIMALEEITDALHSIITTNEVTFGGQSIVGPEGANIKVTDLAKGLRYFELPPDQVDKLRPLQLTKSAPEVFQYLQVLQGKKEKAVGSVASSLAQQASQGASGSSMALIQSQAISYNSGVQRSYFRLLSEIMTKLIRILSKYADTERVVKIVGKSKSSDLKEFKYTGQDLNSISSIVYEMVNPVSQTVGGRLNMAETLIKAGMIKNPKQYLLVATTGQLDVMTEEDESDQLLIVEENEWLSEGKQVQVVITENHAEHIKNHMSVLSSPIAKEDPVIVSTVLDHINDHLQKWQDASVNNPGILIATGQQPLMPPPPPGMPPGPGGPPPGPMPMHPPGPGPAQIVGGGQSPVIHKADEVRGPNLPNIAGTKEKPVIPGVTDQGL